MNLCEARQIELLEHLQQEAYGEAEKSLKAFIVHAWDSIESRNKYVHNWHIDLICEHLEAVSRGKIKRLIINIPPRYMKSLCATVMWPVWSWIKEPGLRWVFASYSQSLSTTHSLNRRRLIQSPWYQGGWQERFELAPDQNAKMEFVNDKTGHMIATSVGGTVTGKGGDIIVVDDPHNPMEAQSDIQRQHAIDFFDQTLSTRLDNKKEGAIVVIMQRLHENDLTGHLINQDGWEHLCIPARFEFPQVYRFPMTKRSLEMPEGAILFPEREGSDELDKQKVSLGSYGFAAQYQQQPSPHGGGVIKKDWWRFYDHPLPHFNEVIQTWDLAFKKSDFSDYVVGQVWGRKDANKYLLDQVRAKMDFPETLEAFKRMTQKWPQAHQKIVEDKANGSALISTLKDHIPGIRPFIPKGDKESRVAAVCAQIEAGNVYLPEPSSCSWVDDFILETMRFPRGKYDDQVDAMSCALANLENSAVRRLEALCQW